MDKQSLLQLLANNQLGDLFEILKNEQGFYKDLVLLESRWNDLRAKQRNDLISSENAGIEMAQIRNSLLELIELTGSNRTPAHAPTPARPAINRTWILVLASCAGLFILYEIYRFASSSGTEKSLEADQGTSPTTLTTPGKSVASHKQLNVSQVQPITVAAGDSFYERVYTLVKSKVESTGGDKSLITLTVGLNFKGSINTLLSTEKFRLIADELPGPLAPSNFVNELVDSKSYKEGDIKFELSDQIRQFSVIVEGKEDKKWNFTW